MSAISIFYFVLEAGVQEVVTLNNGDVSECTSRDAVRLIVGEDQWDMLLQFFLTTSLALLKSSVRKAPSKSMAMSNFPNLIL